MGAPKNSGARGLPTAKSGPAPKNRFVNVNLPRSHFLRQLYWFLLHLLTYFLISKIVFPIIVDDIFLLKLVHRPGKFLPPSTSCLFTRKLNCTMKVKTSLPQILPNSVKIHIKLVNTCPIDEISSFYKSSPSPTHVGDFVSSLLTYPSTLPSTECLELAKSKKVTVR